MLLRLALAAWGGVIAAQLAPALLHGTAGVAGVLAAAPWPAGADAVLAAAVRHAAVVALALAVAAPCWCLGRGLWTFLRAPRRDGTLPALAAYPLGYGAASLTLLGLLLVDLWFPAVLVGAPLAVALLAGRRPSRADRAALRPRAWSAPAVLAAALLACHLPWMLAPVTHTDGWEYFLAGPERWLARHGHAVLVPSAPLLYPALCELPNVYPVWLGADAAVKWLGGLGLLCGIGAAARVVAAGATGWAWLAFATASTPMVLLGSGKNEGLLAGFLLLAFAAAAAAPRSRAARTTAGLLAGMALGGKYLSGLNAIWIPLAAGWGGAVPALATAALPLLPWLARAWLVTGDPAYPVLQGAMPGWFAGLDARNGAVWRLTQYVPRPDGSAPAWFLVGLIKEHGAVAWLLPALALAGGSRRRLAAAAGLVGLAWWQFFPGPQTERWAFPATAVLVLAAGAELGGMARRGRAARAAVGLALALPWAYGFERQCLGASPLPYVLGRETAAAYTGRMMTTLADVRAWAAAHPAGGATLLLGEMREYGFAKPCLAAGQHADGRAPLLWRLTAESASEAELMKKFRQLRVTRIVYNAVLGLNNARLVAPFRWTPRQVALWSTAFGRRFALERPAPASDHVMGLYAVYRLRPPGPPPALPAFLPGVEVELADALALAQARRYAAAVAAYAADLDRLPPVGQFLDAAASAAREGGDFARAWRWYRPGFAAGNVDSENAFGYGATALALGRYAEAARGFTRAIPLYPEWSGLARIMLARTRFLAAWAAATRDPGAARREADAALAELEAAPPAAALAPYTGLMHALRAWLLARRGAGAAADREAAAAAATLPELRDATVPALAAYLAETAATLRRPPPVRAPAGG